jgi:glycosyltransferase involved in cell wall biosynthesis
MKKLVLGVTLGMSTKLLSGQAAYFKKLGYDVYIIANNDERARSFCEIEQVNFIPINIARYINPLKDIMSLFQIIKHFKKLKPEIINVGTPKMALLGILGAWFAGIENRVYTCRGLRFEGYSGINRLLLKQIEKFIVLLAKRVIYVSPSLMSTARINNVCICSKSVVFANGSSNGINLNFFNKKNINQTDLASLRNNYGLKDKFIIGFAGRINKEKGINELVDAFVNIKKIKQNVALVLLGRMECSEKLKNKILSTTDVFVIPLQSNVPLYLSLFDIFVLPSWREGFPNVAIEAAALGIPVIVSNATGCVDSVKDGYNGCIFELKNIDQLTNQILNYIDNKELRIVHGNNGLEWAKRFKSEIIWNELHKFYTQITTVPNK